MGDNMGSTSDVTPSDGLPLVGDIGKWLLDNEQVIEAWAAVDTDWVELVVSSPAGKQKFKLPGGTWFVFRADVVVDFSGIASLIRRSEREERGRLEHEGAKHEGAKARREDCA